MLARLTFDADAPFPPADGPFLYSSAVPCLDADLDPSFAAQHLAAAVAVVAAVVSVFVFAVVFVAVAVAMAVAVLVAAAPSVPVALRVFVQASPLRTQVSPARRYPRKHQMGFVGHRVEALRISFSSQIGCHRRFRLLEEMSKPSLTFGIPDAPHPQALHLSAVVLAILQEAAMMSHVGGQEPTCGLPPPWPPRFVSPPPLPE